MTLRLASLSGAIALSLVLPLPSTVAAGDFGILGQTWEIAEPDFLLTINSKLKGLEASGELDRLNQQMVKRTKHRVRNPHPVSGISETTKPKTWLHDPSIVVGKDILDHKGRVIAASGTKSNPLENVKFNRRMVFIQGNSKEQIDWAVREFGGFNSRIIFVDGSPFDEMKERKQKFYFDQRGFLVKKFGISQVPAIIEGEGSFLRIREVLPPPRKKADKA
tara:strand:- start:48575 stop:49234 length:660 start_codon:yes stop_codon:yes gene_type:complete